MNSNQVAQDLSRHAMQDLENVLNRHMAIAQTVLDPADVGMMLLNLSNGMAMGAALYSLQMAKDEKLPDDVWEMVRVSLARLFEVGKPILMERFDALGRAKAA